MEHDIEYELIDIEFNVGYKMPDEKGTFACEDALSILSHIDGESNIEYDSEGIPKGRTKEESLIRRKFIYDHIQRWREEHRDNPQIYNEDLHEFIKINQLFLLESVGHAAYSYLSTKAVLKMEDVMRKARKVGQTNAKEGNSNQKAFSQMIVMRYKSDELGIVKMTVGVRNRTQENVEYSITVPDTGKPFIEKNIKRVKKKKHHK